MTFETVQKNLEARGFLVHSFASAAEAAAYLDGAVDGVSVAFGGSVTLQQMDLHSRLASHNDVIWHWTDGPEVQKKAAQAQAYITSANGLAETGELVNIDGAGNRVSSMLFGHERLYFVIGRNKLAPTYEEALWRARNIAAPKNAQRLGRKTPCAVKGDRCYDCKSPDRICRSLVVLWEPMLGMAGKTEILLVDEDLGY
jgi:hypothetical protein